VQISETIDPVGKETNGKKFPISPESSPLFVVSSYPKNYQLLKKNSFLKMWLLKN